MNIPNEKLDVKPNFSDLTLPGSWVPAKSNDKYIVEDIRNFIDFLAISDGYAKLAKAVNWFENQGISAEEAISLGLNEKLIVSLHQDDECTLILTFKGWDYSRKRPSKDFLLPWFE